MDDLDDFDLRAELGPEWWHDLCPDKQRFYNPADVLPFGQLINWLSRYRPAATVHLSGGEPLLRPDIEDGVELLLSAGHPVVVVTNGMLLSKRPRLLSLPVKWVATYHQPCATLERFRAEVEPLRKLPHVIHTVVSRLAHAKALPELYRVFDGFNFRPKWDHNPKKSEPDMRADPDDLAELASYRLTLITPDGAVYPCNTCGLGPFGNIYSLTWDEMRARTLDAQSAKCVKNNRCSAYQTARLTQEL
jgi:MoaA/NifB/PqqE/SkfB family radical SAM enzyme